VSHLCGGVCGRRDRHWDFFANRHLPAVNACGIVHSDIGSYYSTTTSEFYGAGSRIELIITRRDFPAKPRAAMMASRNHNSFCAAKLNQTHLQGELNDSFGPAFAPSLVNTRHKITEGQRDFPAAALDLRNFINFHDTNLLVSCKQVACHPRFETDIGLNVTAQRLDRIGGSH
jgi:hypothetical protein